MLALVEGAAALRKRPAVATVDASAVELLGSYLMETEFYQQLVETYMETRDGRGALPEFNELVLAAREMDVGSQAQIGALKVLLGQLTTLEPTLRSGEMQHSRNDLLKMTEACWTQQAKFPVDESQQNLESMSQLVSEAKVAFPMADRFHDVALQIGEMLVARNRSTLMTQVEECAKEVVARPLNMEARSKLKAALDSALGVKFDMCLRDPPETSPIPFARILLFKASSAKISDEHVDSLLSLMDALIACAEKGPDEIKFVNCYDGIKATRALLQHYDAFHKCAGDDAGRLQAAKDKHWIQFVEFTRLWIVMKTYLALIEKNNAATAMEEPTLVDTLRGVVSYACKAMQDLCSSREAKAKRSVAAIAEQLRPLAKGAANGKDWSEGLKKTATVADLMKHVTKDDGLLAFDHDTLVRLRDELTSATHFILFICMYTSP